MRMHFFPGHLALPGTHTALVSWSDSMATIPVPDCRGCPRQFLVLEGGGWFNSTDRGRLDPRSPPPLSVCESLFYCDNIVQDARDQCGAGEVLEGIFIASHCWPRRLLSGTLGWNTEWLGSGPGPWDKVDFLGCTVDSSNGRASDKVWSGSSRLYDLNRIIQCQDRVGTG